MKVAFDIDGVLADVKDAAQRYLVEGKDWDAYFAQTKNFPPIVPMVELVRVLIAAGQQVCFVSGRPEHNRGPTESWLHWHVFYGTNIPPRWKSWLFMRPDSDQSETCDLKLRILRSVGPDLVFEDDPKAVSVLHNAGFVVVQVHGFRYNRVDLVPPLRENGRVD